MAKENKLAASHAHPHPPPPPYQSRCDLTCNRYRIILFDSASGLRGRASASGPATHLQQRLQLLDGSWKGLAAVLGFALADVERFLRNGSD